ncbi:MAG: YDG/SRA domain-containing protein [Candidatus Bathyarchaeia archaeon]
MILLRCGDILSNHEILKIFDVCAQRGIRYNGNLQKGIRHVVLITILHKTREESLRDPYYDRLEGNFLLYTGEGRVGTQKMVRGNLVLKRQMTEGYPVFVFEKKSPGKYMFLGRYNVFSVNVEIQPDIKGQRREVFVFKLKRTSKLVSLDTIIKPGCF